MPAITTNKFRVFRAQSFMVSLSNYYMFIGRPQNWGAEPVPDTPTNGEQEQMFLYDDMIAMKRITESDRSHAIRNQTWTSGRYYNAWRHDYDGTVTVKSLGGTNFTPTSVADANFYVVTANNVVYVCVYAPDAPSTIDPSGSGTGSFVPFTLADGYRWLFVGKPRSADVLRFKTNNYFPIRTVASNPGSTHEDYTQWQSQEAAHAAGGAVYTVLVENGGSGYGASQTGIPLTIRGDGSGFAATANSNAGGQINSVTITSYGTGYSWITLAVGGTGTSASLKGIPTPLHGLGGDPIYDLYAYNAICNARFEYGEAGGTFPVHNDYRRIGLIVDPLEYGTTDLLDVVSATNCYTLVVTNPTSGSIAIDHIIEDDTTRARGIIVDFSSAGGNTTIKVIRTQAENLNSPAAPQNSFETGHSYTTYSGGSVVAQGSNISTVGTPDIESDSGVVVYYENRRPISRDENQIEDVKVIFQF